MKRTLYNEIGHREIWRLYRLKIKRTCSWKREDRSRFSRRNNDIISCTTEIQAMIYDKSTRTKGMIIYIS